MVKIIVHRPRPGIDLVIVAGEGGGFSFPSGHVVFYVTCFGFLTSLLYTRLKRPMAWRAALLAFPAFFVATVGVSRIYLSTHWLSDVLGGYLLGSLWLALSLTLYRWGQPRYLVHQPGAPKAPG